MGIRAAPRFDGEVSVTFLRDGRNVRVDKPFSFTDSRGVKWYVSAGRVCDGASIPALARPVVGGPYDGKHRDAAIVHDEAYACAGVMIGPGGLVDTHDYTRADADRAFLEAMEVCGVPFITRRLMYSAVRMFGWYAWNRACKRVIGGGPWKD